MHLEREGFFLIARIKQVGDRILERIMIKKNIDIFNGAQGRILYVLWKRDGIPIKELSKQTGLAMSSLTTMLNRMEATGLIHRQHGDKDRREVLIFLTETSRALELDFELLMYKINSIYYKDFDMWEIMVFESYLRRILENVEDALQVMTIGKD